MTLRLDDERAATLELVAQVDDKSLTDTVRAAIDAHIDERRNDADFQARLKAAQERHAAVLERLAR